MKHYTFTDGQLLKKGLRRRKYKRNDLFINIINFLFLYNFLCIDIFLSNLTMFIKKCI